MWEVSHSKKGCPPSGGGSAGGGGSGGAEPPNGRFSPEQQRIIEMAEEAQRAGKTGNPWSYKDAEALEKLANEADTANPGGPRLNVRVDPPQGNTPWHININAGDGNHAPISPPEP